MNTIKIQPSAIKDTLLREINNRLLSLESEARVKVDLSALLEYKEMVEAVEKYSIVAAREFNRHQVQRHQGYIDNL